MVTEDGYILGLFRIHGQIKPGSEEKAVVHKAPVLLQHGLGVDMMQWVMNDAWRAPAFILARQGYDVWLGNNRGTTQSYGHASLDYKKDRAY